MTFGTAFTKGRRALRAQKDDKPAKANIVTLPTELQIKIFKFLDRASSTCLGLINTRLYPIHLSIRGKIPLNAWCVLPPDRDSGVYLFELLRDWVGPLVIDRARMRFTSKKAFQFATENRDTFQNFCCERGMVERGQKQDEEELGGFYVDGKWKPVEWRDYYTFYFLHHGVPPTS